MHVDTRTISVYSRYSHRFYMRYTIPKSQGGKRNIRQPNSTMKGLQAWILRNILDKLTPSKYATAYRKKIGLINNTIPHQNNRYFLCVDIEEFFPSISIRRVAKVFKLIGYSARIANVFAGLCTCDNCLPQGGVTSPALSNLIASKLDRRIAGYAERRNISYTRYADDITLSSNDPKVLCASLPLVEKIIKSEHFKPNDSKLRILGPRRQCYVTGLTKNTAEPRFGIGRTKKRRMRSVMHRLTLGLMVKSQYQRESSIEGWLSYLKSVDQEGYRQMTKYWNTLKERHTAMSE